MGTEKRPIIGLKTGLLEQDDCLLPLVYSPILSPNSPGDGLVKVKVPPIVRYSASRVDIGNKVSCSGIRACGYFSTPVWKGDRTTQNKDSLL